MGRQVGPERQAWTARACSWTASLRSIDGSALLVSEHDHESLSQRLCVARQCSHRGVR
jgi:hypothetical protein